MVTKTNEKELKARMDNFKTSNSFEGISDLIFDSFSSNSEIIYMRLTGAIHKSHLESLKDFGLDAQGMFGTSSNEALIGFSLFEGETK